MLRNNSYDTLGINISNLKSKLKEHENMIIKSKDRSVWQDVIDTHNEVNDLCESVYSQFRDCRSDFDKGAINLARYKEHLKQFNDLLIGVDEKIKNKNLHAEEIAKEVKRFI